MHIHQILNHYTSRQELDPGFLVLDNSGNERPDWFEYWPMRKFLLAENLDEHAFYGFLSPRFQLKTSLSSAAVREFILACGAGTDVILLSPSIHNSACFLNVFEHGDSEHPGLKSVAKQLFERLGIVCDLDTLVSDSRNTVHSNYFIAKPRFWRAWLAITEGMFGIAESTADPLGAALRAPTTYRGSISVQMKIFVMERIATLLLSTDRSFAVRARDPFVARSRIYKLPVAIVCDALKIAYATQGRSQYKDVFLWVRGLRHILNFQVRFAAALGFWGCGACLKLLRSHWLPGKMRQRQ
ncbi:MAG: hypothetical protein M3N50_03500 [Pseudomonadota bacterium]|nr:hypothetical protein [Pseudomonadota bacterium]